MDAPDRRGRALRMHRRVVLDKLERSEEYFEVEKEAEEREKGIEDMKAAILRGGRRVEEVAQVNKPGEGIGGE